MCDIDGKGRFYLSAMGLVKAIKFKLRYFIAAILLLFSCSSLAKTGVYPLTEADCKIMRDNHVITEGNPVTCSRLSRVVFNFVDFNHQAGLGEVVVFDAVAEHTYKIFNEIFARGIAVNKAVRMEAYRGDDDASLADNNTAAFNGRAITAGREWSKHAYGVAIDFNPLQNPYIGQGRANGVLEVKPPASVKKYINRNETRPSKARRAGMAEEVVDIFYKHGFLLWGGEWDDPVDYQHFEIGSRQFINQLTSLSAGAAVQLFNDYVDKYRLCLAENQTVDALLARNACILKVKK